MTVVVDRDAPGDLVAGVERRVAAADAVDAVASIDVRGVRPGLNDLRVAVDAELRVRVPPDDGPGDPCPDRSASTVADLIAEGYGLWDVDVVE